jgi:hypothetical protein
MEILPIGQGRRVLPVRFTDPWDCDDPEANVVVVVVGTHEIPKARRAAIGWAAR